MQESGSSRMIRSTIFLFTVFLESNRNKHFPSIFLFIVNVHQTDFQRKICREDLPVNKENHRSWNTHLLLPSCQLPQSKHLICHVRKREMRSITGTREINDRIRQGKYPLTIKRSGTFSIRSFSVRIPSGMAKFGVSKSLLIFMNAAFMFSVMRLGLRACEYVAFINPSHFIVCSSQKIFSIPFAPTFHHFL